jgi:glycosyltransferase involved in cell wall biosynthesis
MHLCRFLQRASELTVLHAVGEPASGMRMLRFLSSRAFVTLDLINFAARERFDVAVYVPASGLTAVGLARAGVLRFLVKSPVIAIGLEERNIGALHRFLAAFARPELVLSPARETKRRIERLGVETGFIMPGVDERSFKPVGPETKARLKLKYDLPIDRFIVLHVGQVAEGRNLEVFLRYRDWGPDVQPVIKAGRAEASWVRRLRMAGIIVINEYIDAVHELYQAADCYLFPAASLLGADEFPISVIEACACNTPVLTTRFGALPGAIPEGNGFHYYDRVSEIASTINRIRGSASDTASKVKDFSWEGVFRKYLYPSMRSLVREEAVPEKH